MICAMATLDTGLFVYPSLSRSLLMECGLLGLTLTAFIHSLFHDTKLDIGKLHLFIIIWIVYLIIHGCLSPVMEVYRTVYLIVTLFSIIPLSYCLRTGLLTKMGIRIGLLLIAAAHIVYVLAQWFGLMNSGNTLYPLTGCCDNHTLQEALTNNIPFIFFSQGNIITIYGRSYQKYNVFTSRDINELNYLNYEYIFYFDPIIYF